MGPVGVCEREGEAGKDKPFLIEQISLLSADSKGLALCEPLGGEVVSAHFLFNYTSLCTLCKPYCAICKK